MRLVSAVRGAFATSMAPGDVGPFNLFHPEQKALGKLVMDRSEGDHGVELDTISYYEFRQLLASPPLSDSSSVQETLEALRTADDAADLVGRNRLVEVQNHLVDLLEYLEGKEGYTIFPGKRKKCGDVAELKSVPAGEKSVAALPG